MPHGTVHINWYHSDAIGAPRAVYVYTPPGYEQGSARYPVLYLMHGAAFTQEGWTTTGRANFILDNLIAEGKAKPMVIVMPYGYPQAATTIGLDQSTGLLRRPRKQGAKVPDGGRLETQVVQGRHLGRHS